MERRKLLLIGMALLIAVATVLMARSLLKKQPVAVQQADGSVVTVPGANIGSERVLVANKNLPAGKLIVESDISWQPWPEGGKSDEFYLVEGETEIKTIIGAVVRQNISRGVPITAGMIVKKGEQGFLAAVLQPGQRAVSLKVDEVTGVAGFIQPGDRVDVILAHNIALPGDTMPSRWASETVLNNLRVVAVDQSLSDKEHEAKEADTVTLEVTPKQAEIARLVAQLGTLSLSLRAVGASDADAAQADTATGDDAMLARVKALADGKLPDDAKRSFSWDSDVSPLIPPPLALGGQIQEILDDAVTPLPANNLPPRAAVTVVRGVEAGDMLPATGAK